MWLETEWIGEEARSGARTPGQGTGSVSSEAQRGCAPSRRHEQGPEARDGRGDSALIGDVGSYISVEG